MIGAIILSKKLEISSVGQLHVETIGRPGLFGRRDAKHVLLFATLRNCRDQNNPLRSLIILSVPQPMSSTV